MLAFWVFVGMLIICVGVGRWRQSEGFDLGFAAGLENGEKRNADAAWHRGHEAGRIFAEQEEAKRRSAAGHKGAATRKAKAGGSDAA